MLTIGFLWSVGIFFFPSDKIEALFGLIMLKRLDPKLPVGLPSSSSLSSSSSSSSKTSNDVALDVCNGVAIELEGLGSKGDIRVFDEDLLLSFCFVDNNFSKCKVGKLLLV